MEHNKYSLLKNISVFQGDYNLNNFLEKLTYQFYSSMILIRVVLTIFLRIGFLFVHIGTVPVTNVNLIIVQNLVDFTCTTFVYFLLGFIISFSDDNNGLNGGKHWIGETNINITEALIGWQVVSITAAISMSGVIGRLHTIGCIISAILLSGFLQPFLINLTWTSKGWMKKNNFLEKEVIFQDSSGAAVIHVVGGLSALIGCLILGRRILKLKDIDKSSVPSSSPAIVFAGYFLIFLGLQGISSINVPDKLEQVLVNNLLATSSSSLIVIVLHFLVRGRFSSHWKSTRCIQSVISGLVAVSGGPDIYSPIISIALGSITGFIFYGFSEIIFRSALEDNCNIIPTHLISGFLGSLITSLNAYYNSKEAKSVLIDVVWQAICLISIMGAVIIIMVPAFLLLKLFKCLRNRSEFFNHLRSTEILKKSPRKFSMQRIFSLNKESTIFLKPGSFSKLLKENFTNSFLETISRRDFLKFKESTEPMGQNENETNLKINKKKKGENFEEILYLKESRMKKHRNVYTIQSMKNQRENFFSTVEMNFQKNLPNSEVESKKKSRSFQGFGAGDSVSNYCLFNEEENKNKGEVKIQEDKEDSKNIKEETINAKDFSCEIRRTSKMTNLAKPLSTKSSIDFLFGPKENFPSNESLDENPKFLRKILSAINLDLVSKCSSQSTLVRKSF